MLVGRGAAEILIILCIMIGIILAIALSTHCTVTGEDRTGILLSCNDTQKTELRIPIGDWPQVWHGPELGFTYEIDSEGHPVPSKPNLEVLRQVYLNSLREGRRWRRPAMQQPIPQLWSPNGPVTTWP